MANGTTTPKQPGLSKITQSGMHPASTAFALPACFHRITIGQFRAGPDTTADEILIAVAQALEENPGIWAPTTRQSWWAGENTPFRQYWSLEDMTVIIGAEAPEQARAQALERVKNTAPPELAGMGLYDPHPGVEVVRAWIARARQGGEEA